MVRTVKLRLKDKHAAELNRQAAAVNYVWNYVNETQQKAAQSGRPWLNWQDLQRLTAGSSKLLGIHSHTIVRVCREYDTARRCTGKPWLRWRGRKSLGWIPFNQGKQGVTIRPDGIQFRRNLYQTMHWRDILEGAFIRAGSFNQDARGRWYINMPIEFPEAVGQAPATTVGIDLGLKTLATLSSGDTIKMPSFYRASEFRLGTAQRARKTKRVRAIHAKIANRRRDYLHKASTKLAKEFGLIVVGDVSPSTLSQTNRAKSVHDAGWSDFKRMLSYKSIRNGGRTLEVSERLSTQLCSDCGVVGGPKGIAQLGIREWTCGGCGVTHDRDVNAARNILARGLASLAEGAARQAEQPMIRSGFLITPKTISGRGFCSAVFDMTLGGVGNRKPVVICLLRGGDDGGSERDRPDTRPVWAAPAARCAPTGNARTATRPAQSDRPFVVILRPTDRGRST